LQETELIDVDRVALHSAQLRFSDVSNIDNLSHYSRLKPI
jgi:hypothetical protein